MLYTLNLHSAVCQLYLHKTGRKQRKSMNRKQNCWEFIPWAMSNHWKFQSSESNSHVLLFWTKVSRTQLKEYYRGLDKSSSNRVSVEYFSFTNYSGYSDFNFLGSYPISVIYELCDKVNNLSLLQLFLCEVGVIITSHIIVMRIRQICTDKNIYNSIWQK